MLLINLYPHSLQVCLQDSAGNTDYLHLAPKGRADVPEGFVLAPNFALYNPKLKIVEPEAVVVTPKIVEKSSSTVTKGI